MLLSLGDDGDLRAEALPVTRYIGTLGGASWREGNVEAVTGLISG